MDAEIKPTEPKEWEVIQDTQSTFKDATLNVPDYRYWLSELELDAAVQTRNNNTGWTSWSYKLGSFTISGTGNIAVTGVWFTPKMVRFSVCDQNAHTGFGAMTDSAQYANNIALGTQITSQCIYYGSPVKARAVYVSMDSDGFTINCTYFTTTSYVNYEAIG